VQFDGNERHQFGVVQDYMDPSSFCITDGVVDEEKTKVVLYCAALHCTVRHWTH